MANRKSISKFLKVMLNIALIVLGVLTVGAVLTVIYNPSEQLDAFTTAWRIALVLVGAGLSIWIVFILRRIVDTIIERKPFVKENVGRFKRIGYGIFGIGVLDTIVNYPKHSGFELLASPYGSIKGSIVLFIVLGCLALLLGEVFQSALEIKSENDLTI